MKTRFRFLTYGLIALTVTLTSCEKEGLQGPAGPAGPSGQQGIQGEAGPAGEDGEALGVPGPQGETGAPGADGNDGTDGTDGTDGNANIIASSWIATDFNTSPSLLSNFSIPIDDLTPEMADSALIMAYGKRILATHERIYILPVAFPQRMYQFYVSDSDGDGSYNFICQGTSGDGNPYLYDTFAEVRYVIAPSTSITGKNINEDFTKMEYHDAMDYLGLEY